MPKGTILIVDDDPDIALASRLYLEKAGFGVVEARNSVDGLQIIRNQKIDAIVLDVMMDSATEGFQMSLTLRSLDKNSEYKQYATIPIIMLTSIHTTTPVRFAPDEDYLPVDLFLEKPVDPTELVNAVEGLLAKSTQG